MVDLVFSNSAGGALRFSDNGESDIVAMHFWADIGDISDIDNHESRRGLYTSLLDAYGERGIAAVVRFMNTLYASLTRLRKASRRKEAVRIWWSDHPSEACGFHWAMEYFLDSRTRLTAVKAPLYYEEEEGLAVLHNGIAGLPPHAFPLLLREERPVPAAERRARADEWQALARENAPLRALINGRLRSVSEDFYDTILRRHIPPGIFQASEAVSATISQECLGVGEWWYAERLRRMVERGELVLVEQKENFLYDILRKPCDG